MMHETKIEPAATEPSMIAAPAPEPQQAPATAPAAPTAASADYGDLTLPHEVSADPAELAAATELFRGAALSKEQAQKFVDFAAARDRAATERGAKAFGELQQRWVSEIKADPDIGGPRLDAALASAAHAIDRLGIPGLKEALNLTGAGNNPAIVKAFVRLGQMMQEDRFAPGRAPAQAAPRRTPAEIIYDGNPKQPKE